MSGELPETAARLLAMLGMLLALDHILNEQGEFSVRCTEPTVATGCCMNNIWWV